MYLFHGKLTAKSEYAEELANILLEASKLVSTAKGSRLYVIGRDLIDLNSIYTTEIWESKKDHDNSLQVGGVKKLIMKVMPMLDGPPSKGQELEIFG